MPACLNGAEPKPGSSGLTVFLDTNDLPEPVRTMINIVSPLSLEQQIVAAVLTDTLCSGNPDDPGQLDLGDLAWDMVGGAIPNPFGSPGTLGWWIGQKLQYYAFLRFCQCKVQTEVPPPIIVPTPPSGAPVYPTDPNAQPQIDRVERNTQGSNEGLLTLYNGLQLVSAVVGDMAVYTKPNYAPPFGHTSFPIAGEGFQPLQGMQTSDGYTLADRGGLRIVVTALPTKYKVRGTVIPRYYGIGSIYWLATADRSNGDIVVGRQSIHYLNDWFPQPPNAYAEAIGWRLMPGAQATVYQSDRTTDLAIYQNSLFSQDAATQFDRVPMPPGWTDRPFYPLASGRTSLPSGSKP